MAVGNGEGLLWSSWRVWPDVHAQERRAALGLPPGGALIPSSVWGTALYTLSATAPSEAVASSVRPRRPFSACAPTWQSPTIRKNIIRSNYSLYHARSSFAAVQAPGAAWTRIHRVPSATSLLTHTKLSSFAARLLSWAWL